MKYLGGIILLIYAAIATTGFEPFTTEERGAVPEEHRRSPGGLLFWHGGFMGGK